MKFDPIDPVRSIAVIGILIGDRRMRGVGLAGEVITAAACALRDRRGIELLELGVRPDNTRAIRAYERIGFGVILKTDDKWRMRLRIADLHDSRTDRAPP